jgi:hypothetical protein
LRTILLSTLAVIATSALAPAGAGPMPLNPAVSADSGLTLVRDGCGRGFRFSNYRQACVPIEGYGYGGGGGYVDPGAAAAAAVAAGVAGAIIGGGGGGGGYRGGYGGGNYRGGGGGGQRVGGGGGGPRVGGPGGGNRSQGFAGPPQNWKKPGTGIR